MEREEIRDLAESYGDLLLLEYNARKVANEATGEAERIKVHIIKEAYANDTIDGKNADIRKVQEAEVLADNESYRRALQEQAAKEEKAALAEINRRQFDALISLTKAWLYSQSGIA